MNADISNRRKTHKELLSSVSAIAHNGDMLWFPKPGSIDNPELVFDASTVHPDFRHLLGASHLLYKIAFDMTQMLNPLILLLEQHNLDDAVPVMLAHQKALETAMRCAVVGTPKVVSEQK